jgi:hypothetical protein
MEIQLTISAVPKVERNTKRMIFVARLLSGGRDDGSWGSGMDRPLSATGSIDSSLPPLDGRSPSAQTANFLQFRRVTRQAEEGRAPNAAPGR